ncbi:aldo/keto reductase [Gluconobacter cerinus]|uniref:aldo/keto reductase n=1 Tax=Gluconobacter cerinus TaxID=38307 RepID=UPI001B8D5FBE|nr:aldo/keto reductase [Gluconobacter cerinus]MBS1045727.1 aldo/keto reductase [Gluconobacter cerinus]
MDTANVYQFSPSEEIFGELLQGRREDFVFAAKFSNGAVPAPSRLVTGNSRKAMVASVEASLAHPEPKADLFLVSFASVTGLPTAVAC